MVKAFIDTSILANWMLFKEKKIEERTKISNLISSKKFNLIEKSFKLLDYLERNPKLNVFVSSELVISELFTVMKQQSRADLFYNLGIPIRYVGKINLDLTHKEVLDVNRLIFIFFEDISKRKGIEFLIAEEIDLGLVSELIVEHNVQTPDALLVSIAINNKCDYFITVDNHLIESLKNYNKIKVCYPETFLNNIRS